LGITAKIRKEEILSLSVENYHQGPEPDRDKPGEIWIFGKKVNDKEVYIKLKIAQVDGVKIAKCLSFHPNEFSMSYPYSEEEAK